MTLSCELNITSDSCNNALAKQEKEEKGRCPGAPTGRKDNRHVMGERQEVGWLPATYDTV